MEPCIGNICLLYNQTLYYKVPFLYNPEDGLFIKSLWKIKAVSDTDLGKLYD
jgi:hypothetical protein